MHMPGLIPLLIVLALAFLLFGRPGRLSGLMEDLGKGIRGFRKGLGDKEEAQATAANTAAAEPSQRQIPDHSKSEQGAANRDRSEA